MDGYLPPGPDSYALRPPATKDLSTVQPSKDWPHAPVHRISENGIFILTASTLHKQRLFDSAPKLDLLERLLLSEAKRHKWQLEAWAVLSNHYHFVARGAPDSTSIAQLIREVHSQSAIALNKMTGGRRQGGLAQLSRHAADVSTCLSGQIEVCPSKPGEARPGRNGESVSLVFGGMV